MKKDNYLHPLMMMVMFISVFAITNSQYAWNVNVVKLLLFFGHIAMLMTLWQYGSLLFKELLTWSSKFIEAARQKMEDHTDKLN